MPARQEATLELVTSPAATRLEVEMVRRVRALVAADATARIALVAPTTRVLDAARRALLREAGPGGALAGVELLHHRSLAQRLLDAAFLHGLQDHPAPRLLSGLEQEALVRAAVAGLPATLRLRRLCDERPRFVLSLQRTLGELREALVTPEDAARKLGARHPVALLHAAHEAALDRLLERAGATDGAGHAREAADAARRLAERGLLPWTHLVHHGGYELVGAQSALVAAVAKALPTLVLAPCGAGPAHATARRGLARWPGARALEKARSLDAPHAAPTLVDVDALFDEDASPEAGTLRLPREGTAPVHAWHVRGTRAEAELAARLAADAHLSRGVPLEEILVVARSLEPYAGHLEAAFGAHGVPFGTSATAPLLRDPWAQAATTLLDVLVDDLPRPRVMELLRSGCARLADKVASPDDIAPDLWDDWTLSARVVRGAGALKDDVIAWHEADVAEQARRREESVEELAREAWVARRRARLVALGEVAAALAADAAAWTACRTHAEHATFLREALRRWLVDPETSSAARACNALQGLLDDLARLDEVIAPGAPAPAPREVRALLHRALAGAATSLGTSDGSGVRVLSAMPARGVPCRELILMGLDQGAFPRRPRHDPFLPDEQRLALRAAAPSLGVKREARDEERQLLALLLGAATERVHVTWQRADDDGKARAPSLFLREIARVTLGRPELEALTARRETDELRIKLPLAAVPGHPALAAAALRERFGREPFRDAMMEAAERRQRRRSVEALARHARRLDEALEAGLATLADIDDMELSRDAGSRARQLSRDGLLGPGAIALPRAISPSSLESFGNCALRWLFQRGLGVPERDEEADDVGVAASELGTLVHGVLESVNRHALAHGGDPKHLATEEALELLRREFASSLRDLAGARLQRVPLAWDVFGRRWLEALERFVESDATRLRELEARVHAVEQDLHADVTLGRGRSKVVLPLRGRVDRIVEVPDGWRIEDFKTSPKVKPHVDRASILQGHRLQGLVYLLLGRAWAATAEHSRVASGDAVVTVAFVPASLDPLAMEPAELAIDELEAAWTETLATLEATWRGGAFALKRNPCEWCAYSAACRRDHAPTRARLEAASEWRDYLDLDRKNTKRPMLADVRAAETEGEDS